MTEERFRALQRQVPLLYAVALANFVGLQLVTSGALGALKSPAMLLVFFVVWRLLHWLKLSRTKILPVELDREVRKTWWYALLISAGFSIWAQYLLTVHPAESQSIVLFGSLGAIGCAYGVSSYPSAARLPLLILGIPLSLRLILSGEVGSVGMGVSLLLVIFLILRLLTVHNTGFIDIVNSRSRIEGERKRARDAEKLARRLSQTDPLTGIFNRRVFTAAIVRMQQRSARNKTSFGIAIIDLDGFKPINDIFGHSTGDEVLRLVAKRLKRVFKNNGLIARLGGDEFAVLLPTCSNTRLAQQAGDKICGALRKSFEVGERRFSLSACCGVALDGGDEQNVLSALTRADFALYHAKASGSGLAVVYSSEMENETRRREAIETRLRSSADQTEVEVVFQPIRDLAHGTIQAYEALARWHSPVLGELSPAEFIPLAEQAGIIDQISEHVLRKAATIASEWPKDVRLSFNLSAVQLCSCKSSEKLLRILDEAELDPARVQLEITETAQLADLRLAQDNLENWRREGVRIYLDDFGAGHASISYLRDMSFDGFKLDGSLVGSATQSARNQALLAGVLELGHRLGMHSVAEHIETEDQLNLLKAMGCHMGQGFLLGEPRPFAPIPLEPIQRRAAA